jgi:DNA-binding response OmpR family regulator
MNVLVIEDDRRIANVLEQGLLEDGHQVYVTHRGDEAHDLIASQHFDVVVLDIMLPGADGIEVLKKVRTEKCDIPILLLTARDSMPEIVRGLDAGADDYITKPFQLEVLLARIRAVGRRGQIAQLPELVVGTLTLDRTQRIAQRCSQSITLTQREYALLELMMRRSPQIVSRAQLVEAGWGYEADVSDNNIDFHVHSLRAKLHIDGQASMIRTVRSIGYTMNESA